MPVHDSGNPHTAASVDADGVRVFSLQRRRASVRSLALGGLALSVLLGAALIWYPSTSTQGNGASAKVTPSQTGTATVEAAAAPSAPATDPLSVTASNAATRAAPVPAESTAALAPATDPGSPPESTTRSDPNDLASYIRPGDVEPTGAELIQALRDAGETEGIAAFNPPGTSPPMVGLAVPADYVLPPGYVRHHQVTDSGEALEPILMYAPDAVLRDAAGQLIPIPEDRVVPPEYAPAGLPIRQVEVPPP